MASGVLSVVAFDVEWHSTCSYDSLEVDGTKYCGNTGPQSAYLTTSSNISFSTGNYGGGYPGFHICMSDDPPPSAVPTPAPTLMACDTATAFNVTSGDCTACGGSEDDCPHNLASDSASCWQC